ncbi:MAG: alpha-ribazole phosphatase family protein [Gammaproteobacteria bacterium]|nr:alpha-ribazole phosphatase family protein [Gammaproteobacteria bacterium]
MHSSNETIIDLLRHGEPLGGNEVFRGRTDDPLTETGWQQMHSTVSDHAHWDNIITSPALRCAKFAEALSERLSIPVNHSKQLWEIDLGEWDGKLFSDIQQSYPDHFAQLWQDPVNNTPPGGEPLPEFQQRILTEWDQLQKKNKGRHVLVIAHGGTIRIIIGHILGMPLESLLKLELPYAGISRIRSYSDKTTTSSSLVFHAGSL